jgi:prophage regulatory protein
MPDAATDVPEGPVPPPIDPWVGIARVQQEVGLSRSTIYRRMSEGGFPRPRELGGGVVRWVLSEIHAWKASRPEAPPGGHPLQARRGRPPKAL